MQNTERFWKKPHRFVSALSPWVTGLLISLLFLGLLEFLLHIKKQDLRKNAESEAVTFGTDLIARFDRELNKLINLSSGLAAYVKINQGHLDATEFQLFLREIHNNSPLIRNIGVAEGSVLRYMEPLKGNEKALGINYRNIPDQWPDIENAIRMKKSTLSGPVSLIQGGQALIYRLPVYIGDQYWGLMSTVINIDALFEAAFKELKDRQYHFAIRLADRPVITGDSILYGDPAILNLKATIHLLANIPNGSWEYTILTKPSVAESNVIRAVEWGGMIFTVILFLLLTHLFKLRLQNKESLNNLRRSEARLQAIINTTLSGVSILNKDGFQIFTNKTCEVIHGYTQSDMVGRHISLMTHPDDVAIGMQKIREILSDQIDSFDGEFRLFHKISGNIVWIHLIATRFPKTLKNDEDGILVFYQNVTKHKENEKKLIELNATKDKFFSIIAHDLRNPFVALLGLSELILIKYNTLREEDRKKKIELIYESALHAYQLVENLLTWSLSQSGGIAFNQKRVALNEAIKNTIQVLFAAASNKSISLINTLDKPLYVLADSYMLETILRSLISNAIKFTPRKGEITIGIREDGNENSIEVYVTDTGIGIPAAMTENLFYLNKNKTTPGTENERGTGLGLILCKEFVDIHGGKIWVESQLGQGSKFIFTLPVYRKAKKLVNN